MPPERVVLAPFTDAHVHLGLVPLAELRAGGIARVVDLGWSPTAAAGWAGLTGVAVAGGLLGPPGGYPSRAGWAPADAAVPVADADSGREAVVATAALGARVVKVTLNADAGPVWGDDVLRAVVDHAHAEGLPVAAHVQGVGQAERAADAGVDVFAHTPWSERLDDGLVARLAGTTTWISTLDIHGHGRRTPAFRTAQDNLARFAAAGGDVRYGTDLGNGPLPRGLNARELRALADAGLRGETLVAALTTGTQSRWNPFAGMPDGLVSVVAGPMPTSSRAADTVRWLGTARTETAARTETDARTETATRTETAARTEHTDTPADRSPR
ncbi:amidohydrolase family protein [Curtobacterium sp. RRHDQ10]|uniref:amidohydrolase family protein n=1 Tax=Curtobacterium phyllosphaerae TaxID=3413379 RepID=UPI003BEF67CF